MNIKKIKPDQYRNIIFGIEDSLVSTVGVLFGISTASMDSRAIITAGLVVIVVEALSMGAGAFLSETSTAELNGKTNKSQAITDGVLMYFSYFFAGFIPLFPYLIFNTETGRFFSVGISLVTLFVLGYVPRKDVRSGFRMAVVAGIAILFGYLVGHFAPL